MVALLVEYWTCHSFQRLSVHLPAAHRCAVMSVELPSGHRCAATLSVQLPSGHRCAVTLSVHLPAAQRCAVMLSVELPSILSQLLVSIRKNCVPMVKISAMDLSRAQTWNIVESYRSISRFVSSGCYISSMY